MRAPSPTLDKNVASMGPGLYPVLGLGSGGRLLRHFQTPTLCDFMGAQKNCSISTFAKSQRFQEAKVTTPLCLVPKGFSEHGLPHSIMTFQSITIPMAQPALRGKFASQRALKALCRGLFMGDANTQLFWGDDLGPFSFFGSFQAILGNLLGPCSGDSRQFKAIPGNTRQFRVIWDDFGVPRPKKKTSSFCTTARHRRETLLSS